MIYTEKEFLKWTSCEGSATLKTMKINIDYFISNTFLTTVL